MTRSSEAAGTIRLMAATAAIRSITARMASIADGDAVTPGGPHGVIVNLSDHPITADIGAGEFTVAAGSALDSFGDTDILSGVENIIGTEFRDVLVGPGNGVTLTGGGGADTFVLTGTNIADLIVDYNQSEGDTIDLTALYNEFTAANGTASASEFLNEHVQYGLSQI